VVLSLKVGSTFCLFSLIGTEDFTAFRYNKKGLSAPVFVLKPKKSEFCNKENR